MLKFFKKLNTLGWVGIVVGMLFLSGNFSQAGDALVRSTKPGYHLTASWTPMGLTQELESWSIHDLNNSALFKRYSSTERDPLTGKLIRWEGVLLSQVVERVLNHLPLENRAQVDLVILRGHSGQRALIPRALIGKYPLLLAHQWDASKLGDQSRSRGPIFSVVPWTSKPRVLSEDLPVESYFVSGVNRIDLTSYKDQYGFLFLKRRTDPSAMRGEKLFVQNCVSCHAVGQGPLTTGMGIQDEKRGKQFAIEGHPTGRTNLKLTERDRRSIVRYLDAHRMENPTSAAKVIRSVQAN